MLGFAHTQKKHPKLLTNFPSVCITMNTFPLPFISPQITLTAYLFLSSLPLLQNKTWVLNFPMLYITGSLFSDSAGIHLITANGLEISGKFRLEEEDPLID